MFETKKKKWAIQIRRTENDSFFFLKKKERLKLNIF